MTGGHRVAAALALIAAGLLAACGGDRGGDTMAQVSQDDSAMAAAVRQARRTLPGFLAALPNLGPDAGAAVKVRLADGTNVEYVWLNTLRYGDGQLHGRINNTVQSVSGYHLGDRLTVDPDSVADWMFVEHDTIRGGYSIRLLAGRMNTKERAGLRYALPPDSAWAP